MLHTPATFDARRAIRRAVPSLGVTGTIGWGTTYYLPAVLRDRFQTDLGITDAIVFAGVAVTLIVSALTAWPVGRLIDRYGAKRLLPVGSVFLAAGLIALAFSSGATSYFVGWVLFGFGMSLGMSTAAFAALAQIAGGEARRSITLLMLFGGMASAIFWPLTLWLDGAFGWRNALLVFAALHICLCLPLHLALPGRRPAALVAMEAPATGAIAPGKRRLAGGLIALIFACNGFVSWGLDLHLIAFFQDYGLSAAAAVSVAALKGPITLIARVGEFAAAGRIGVLASTFVGVVMVTGSLMLALTWQQGIAAALAFVMIHACGTGLLAVSRATLPLALLGSQGYATTMGKIALPTQIVYAVSPLVFTLMVERLGGQGALAVAAVVSVAGLAALVLLQRQLEGAERI